jgi:predicted RNA-binding protein Jag
VEQKNLENLQTILKKNNISHNMIGNFSGDSIQFSNDSKSIINLLVDKTQKTWLNSLEELIMHA